MQKFLNALYVLNIERVSAVFINMTLLINITTHFYNSHKQKQQDNFFLNSVLKRNLSP